MAAAAGRLNVSPSIIKAAKDAGCEAFKQNGRVDCNALSAWLSDPANSEKILDRATELEKTELAILKEKLRLTRHRADLATGKSIDMDEARRAFVRAAAVTKSRLLAIPTSAAPLLIGLDAAGIEEKLKSMVIAALTDLTEHDWAKDTNAA